MFSQAWAKSPDSLKIQAEQTFDCCGLGINLETGKTDPTPTPDDIAWSIEHKVFDNYPYAKCHHNATGSTSKDCQTCFSLITDKVHVMLKVLVFFSSTSNNPRSTLASMVLVVLAFSFHSRRFVCISSNRELVHPD